MKKHYINRIGDAGNLPSERDHLAQCRPAEPVKGVKHVNDRRVSHKSKHYDERGKRGERLVINLDGALKKDIADLSRATGSRSINDFVVTALLELIERVECQSKLAQYRNILGGGSAGNGEEL